MTRPILLLYGKLFLIVVVPFGVGESLLLGLLLQDFEIGITFGFLGAVLFGGLMSVILGTAHIYSVRRLTPTINSGTLSAKHTREIIMSVPYNEGFGQCIRSLNEIGKHRVHRADQESGKIIAKTRINRKTWGELIIFSLQRSSDSLTRVLISSRPRLKSTIIDFGKDLDNVMKIVRFLDKNTISEERT